MKPVVLFGLDKPFYFHQPMGIWDISVHGTAGWMDLWFSMPSTTPRRRRWWPGKCRRRNRPGNLATTVSWRSGHWHHNGGVWSQVKGDDGQSALPRGMWIYVYIHVIQTYVCMYLYIHTHIVYVIIYICMYIYIDILCIFSYSPRSSGGVCSWSKNWTKTAGFPQALAQDQAGCWLLLRSKLRMAQKIFSGIRLMPS